MQTANSNGSYKDVRAFAVSLLLFILAHRLDPQHGYNMTHIDQCVLAYRQCRLTSSPNLLTEQKSRPMQVACWTGETTAHAARVWNETADDDLTGVLCLPRERPKQRPHLVMPFVEGSRELS